MPRILFTRWDVSQGVFVHDWRIYPSNVSCLRASNLVRRVDWYDLRAVAKGRGNEDEYESRQPIVRWKSLDHRDCGDFAVGDCRSVSYSRSSPRSPSLEFEYLEYVEFEH